MRFISKLLPASKQKLVISSIGVLALVVFSSLLLFEVTKAEVVLTKNGEQRTVKTHADTVEELLKDEGITVGDHDALSVKLNAAIKSGMDINYEEAKRVFVSINGQEQQEYFTLKDTVGEFLNKTKLASDHDDVSLDDDDLIKDEMKLAITEKFQIKVNDGGENEKVWATSGKVSDVLASNDIQFDEKSDDKIKPGLDEKVTKDTTITITRVKKVTDVIEEQVAYVTETIKKSSLAKGKKQVINEGKEGTVVKKYEVTMENGKEVSRKLISKETKESSKNRVVAIGTKVVQQPVVETVSRSNGEKAKVLYMTATAFTADCGGCSGHTATGINLKANPNAKVVAVDPSVIPLGTKVWVEGYGYAIAADTGGFGGNHIDVHVPNKSAAYKFGRKRVKVKILD